MIDGDKVLLCVPGVWCGFGCNVDSIFTVLAVKKDSSFGSGTGVQVTPRLQEHHQDGENVWYDAANFVIK